jgi:F-type H+-transporting ATPase subunit a
MIRTSALRFIALALGVAVCSAAAGAQEHKAETKAPAATKAPAGGGADSVVALGVAGQAQAQKAEPEAKKKDYIMPHVLNSDHAYIPWFAHGLEKEIALPHFPPIHIGPITLDLSISKHVFMMLVASSLLLIVMLTAAAGAKRAHAEGRPPRGLAGAIEAMVLYLRNDVILPNVGHHGEKYVPFCLTAFFFILFCNLLGLIPYMATATGNISVTATLAILSFITVEVAGMRALGGGYIKTIIWWPHDLPIAVKAPVSLIMTPVEILGKFTKPFALAMRLFANMTAGHIAVLALIGMIFTFAQLMNYSPAAYGAALIPVALSTAIMGLEVFVAFLQAFIFMLLTAVFIGQIRESHH